jgi:hypothetical protein
LAGTSDFSLLQSISDQLYGHPSLIMKGFQDSFPGVMQLRSEADHLPPSTTEISNEWRHTSTSFTCLHSMHIDSFTFVTYHQFQQPILNNPLLAWTRLFQLQTLYSSEYRNTIVTVKNSKWSVCSVEKYNMVTE